MGAVDLGDGIDAVGARHEQIGRLAALLGQALEAWLGELDEILVADARAGESQRSGTGSHTGAGWVPRDQPAPLERAQPRAQRQRIGLGGLREFGQRAGRALQHSGQNRGRVVRDGIVDIAEFAHELIS